MVKIINNEEEPTFEKIQLFMRTVKKFQGIVSLWELEGSVLFCDYKIL